MKLFQSDIVDVAFVAADSLQVGHVMWRRISNPLFSFPDNWMKLRRLADTDLFRFYGIYFIPIISAHACKLIPKY